MWQDLPCLYSADAAEDHWESGSCDRWTCISTPCYQTSCGIISCTGTGSLQELRWRQKVTCWGKVLAEERQSSCELVQQLPMRAEPTVDSLCPTHPWTSALLLQRRTSFQADQRSAFIQRLHPRTLVKMLIPTVKEPVRAKLFSSFGMTA